MGTSTFVAHWSEVKAGVRSEGGHAEDCALHL